MRNLLEEPLVKGSSREVLFVDDGIGVSVRITDCVAILSRSIEQSQHTADMGGRHGGSRFCDYSSAHLSGEYTHARRREIYRRIAPVGKRSEDIRRIDCRYSIDIGMVHMCRFSVAGIRTVIPGGQSKPNS